MTADAAARILAHIKDALAVFHLPGDVVELRALRVPGMGRAVCAVFDDMGALAQRAHELDEAGAQGCYFTLNPLRADLAGWTDSRVKATDVLSRRWLPIDCDSDKSRPAGTNATDDEKAAGWRVLDQCKATLDAFGLAGAVVGDSGNGYHLCYPIDLPNDESAQKLVKDVLGVLAARCGDEAATVTTSTHDAPRIWKLYGTRARKGPHDSERPHRWARFVSGTPWDAETAARNTALLPALLERERFIRDTQQNRPQGEEITVAERARRYVERMPAAVAGQHGHDQTWEVAQVLARGFALARADSWPILEAYNARCDPPWNDRELLHKIESAENDSRLPIGYLLDTYTVGVGRDHAPPESAHNTKHETPNTKHEFGPIIPASALKLGEQSPAIWNGFLHRGAITLLSALWKAGKTTFLTHLVRAMGEGGEFCSLPILKGTVLYVTEESEQRWARRRDRWGLADHIDFLIRPFASKSGPAQWHAFLAYLAGRLASKQYDLIIFDTLTNLWPVKDENDASNVQTALMPLHSLASASAQLLIHHTRKGDGNEATASRGSGALTAFVDTIMEFRRFNAAERTDCRRVLTSYGRDEDTPDELVIELGDDGYVCQGDRATVTTRELAEEILPLLPGTRPGLTAEEILDRWPGGAKPRRQAFFSALIKGVEDGSWQRAGRGVRGDPHRYYAPVQDNVF